MKVIRKILYILVFLTALLSIFIIVCAFRPTVTERIKTMLYQGSDEEVMADEEADEDIRKLAEDVLAMEERFEEIWKKMIA